MARLQMRKRKREKGTKKPAQLAKTRCCCIGSTAGSARRRAEACRMSGFRLLSLHACPTLSGPHFPLQNPQSSSVSSSLGHIRVRFLVAGFQHSPSLPPSHHTCTPVAVTSAALPGDTNENNSPVFLLKHRAAGRPPREERQYQTRARSNGPRDHDGNHGLHVAHHVHGHARHHVGCPRGSRHGRHGHGRRQQLQDLRKMTKSPPSEP